MRKRLRPAQWRGKDALPAVIAAAPLAGFSFQGDERSVVYHHVVHTGTIPMRAAEVAVQSVDGYLTVGNFRPLGRFLEPLVYSLEFDAAEATGLAPHAVHGVVRLTMVMILALTAARAVSALARSAGTFSGVPVTLVFPMVLATTLVANGRHSPLVLFPFTLIGSVVLILAIAQTVARDQDMRVRPLRRREIAAMVLLGAAAACTYDLVYVAPVLAAVFIAARARAAAMPARALLSTAAARRWLALSVGFLAVFVPTRMEIARRCGDRSCYEGSDISLSGEMFELAAGRSMTGAPLWVGPTTSAWPTRAGTPASQRRPRIRSSSCWSWASRRCASTRPSGRGRPRAPPVRHPRARVRMQPRRTGA